MVERVCMELLYKSSDKASLSFRYKRYATWFLIFNGKKATLALRTNVNFFSNETNQNETMKHNIFMRFA